MILSLYVHDILPKQGKTSSGFKPLMSFISVLKLLTSIFFYLAKIIEDYL